jgi:predicted DNA binding CopG/RHH family protein
MNKTRRLAVRITEAEYQALKKQAAEDGVTMSKMIHGLIFDRYVCVKSYRMGRSR